jgi:hypothetical protein
MDINKVLRRRRERSAARCGSVEQTFHPAGDPRSAAVPSARHQQAEPLDHLLEAQLLRVAEELAGAMLALRPCEGEKPPDPRAAYERLHRAMNDVAALYQRAQLEHRRRASL